MGENGLCREEREEWIVAVFWGSPGKAEAAAHLHRDRAIEHDLGLTKKWYEALGNWSLDSERDVPVKGHNPYDPKRPADAGGEAVTYSVLQVPFFRVF